MGNFENFIKLTLKGRKPDQKAITDFKRDIKLKIREFDFSKNYIIREPGLVFNVLYF